MKKFKIIDEFKQFLMRGNLIDMAVGIVVGVSFSKIVDSLVKDIIMPPLGLILGKIDFSNLFLVLHDGATSGPYSSLKMAQDSGALVLNVGTFLNALISFVIVGFAVFLLVKAANIFRQEKAATTKTCPYCCSEIKLQATRCPSCTSQLSN